MKILIVNDEQISNRISDNLLTKFGSGTIINAVDDEANAQTELEEGLYDVAIINDKFNTLKQFVSENHIDTKIVSVGDTTDDKELTNDVMKVIS